MELKSITIRNFKALQNIHLTEIPNFVVLVCAHKDHEIGDFREVNVLKRLEVANRNGFQFHVSSMSVPWPSTVLRFQTAECVAGLAIIQAPSSVPFRFQFYGTTVGSVTLPPFGEPTAPYPICANALRSEEHTSELQSLRHLVCRLLLEKKKQI